MALSVKILFADFSQVLRIKKNYHAFNNDSTSLRFCEISRFVIAIFVEQFKQNCLSELLV